MGCVWCISGAESDRRYHGDRYVLGWGLLARGWC